MKKKYFVYLSVCLCMLFLGGCSEQVIDSLSEERRNPNDVRHPNSNNFGTTDEGDDKGDSQTMSLNYLSTNWPHSTTNSGWHIVNCNFDYITLAINTYDNDEIYFQISDDWVTIDTKEVISSGEKTVVVRFEVQHNKRNEARSLDILAYKASGEKLGPYTVLQERYTTIIPPYTISTYNGESFYGWCIESQPGIPAFSCYVDSYDTEELQTASSAPLWLMLRSKKICLTTWDETRQEYCNRWYIEFSAVPNNTGADRSCSVYFHKIGGDMFGPYTVIQKGSNSSGGTGDTGGSGGSTDPTANYDISSTTVCAICVSGTSVTKYTKNWYKWVHKTTKSVCLSMSRYDNSNSYQFWKASNNSDSYREGYNVGVYRYKVVDTHYVGTDWYYYFN